MFIQVIYSRSGYFIIRITLALPDNIELILLGDFNVNFTGSNLNIDKAMKRKLIQVTNFHELDQLIYQQYSLFVCCRHLCVINIVNNSYTELVDKFVSYFIEDIFSAQNCFF